MTPGGRRTLMWTIAAAGAAAILVLLLSDVMTLAQLKARREELVAIIAQRPFAATAIFIAGFVLIATLAPGGAVMKVAAGALFGLGAGMAIALVATLLAAALGFVMARYLLRDWVEKRFQKLVATINRGVAQDGTLFLLALRFNPIVPFFMINFAMGLTRMRLWVFVATSFFGLIPASFIYANAGTQLASIEHPSDILTFRLIGSLLLLSLMPLAGRWAAMWIRARRGAVVDPAGEG